MADPREVFFDYCGSKYERFMEALYANAEGEIVLKFWQERLIDKMYEAMPDFPVDRQALLELVRDGREMMYKCNVRDCWGDVGCFDWKNDLWGCGECGKRWTGMDKLPKSMTGKS